MKYPQVFILLVALSWTASDAWAQFGLYGSPAVVELPPVESQESAGSGHAYPGKSAPTAVSARPAPAYGGQAVSRFATPLIPTAAPKPAPLPPGGNAPMLDPPSVAAPNVVDEMLGESESCLPPPWGPEPGCDVSAGCEYDASCGRGLFGRAMDRADCCGGVACFKPNWYVSVSGLIMSRDEPNRLWTTYETNNNPNQLPTDSRFEWRGGGEVRFGRCFCCGSCAVEAAYWMLDPFTSMKSQTHPNSVSTTLDFSDVVWANPALPGLPVDLFDSAAEHRVWRRSEVHSVELNLIRSQIGLDCFNPLDLGWSLGVRYFRFADDLTFGSRDLVTTDWTSDLTAVGYLDEDIENNLVGVQFGCDLNYRVGKWALFVVPRVGIYNNHIQHCFSGYRGDGELFDVDPSTGYPSYPVRSSDDVVSFLTEIDAGLMWQFTTRWSAHVGYRATIATGIGLADHQIPPYVVDTPELANIDTNGQLVLHGGFAGLTYCF